MSRISADHLGYELYPPRRRSEPGYPRLDVWLSDQISGMHFDPRQLRLPVLDQSGGVEWTTIDHPYSGLSNLRLCAGPIDMLGFGEKRLELFSFGGELKIERSEEFTLVGLYSEAPYLVRFSTDAVTIRLMEEAELVLALRRGVWDEHPGEFDRRLSAAQPLELYHAILETILKRMKDLPSMYTESEQQFLYQLRSEREWIVEHLQFELRPLEDIL